jgi:hypothetical protein
MRSRTGSWEDPRLLAAGAFDGRSGLAFIQALASENCRRRPSERCSDD